MEGEKDNGGVSEQQLELARLAKEAFDHHRYWCKGDQHVHAGLSINLLGNAMFKDTWFIIPPSHFFNPK